MKKIVGMTFLVVLMLSLLAGGAFAQGVQNVELHGYVMNRAYTPESGSARFVTERVSLSAVGQLQNTGTAYIEVYFHPWMTDDVLGGTVDVPEGGGTAIPVKNAFTAEQSRTYLESAYVDLPLGQGRMRFGKGRQLNFGITPSYPNRKTTQYGILAETFTQDRIVGFQYAHKKGTFDAGASLYTDYRIGNRQIGFFPNALATAVIPHFVNKDDQANLSGQLAGSLKLGQSTPSFSWHVSGAFGRLLQDDANAIARPYGIAAGANTNREHKMFGLDAVYSKSPFVVKGEWYSGEFSLLRIQGFGVLVGYEPKGTRRFYVRYDSLDNNRAPVYNSTSSATISRSMYTWDTQQLTFGLVQPISKGVWAEVNYERNMEDPPAGVPSVKNDLLFLEVFTGF